MQPLLVVKSHCLCRFVKGFFLEAASRAYSKFVPTCVRVCQLDCLPSARCRHPDFWPDPTSWRPERWIPAEATAAGLSTRSVSDGSKAQPFLPFSTGPRSCIGRNYAMLQMVITMGVLLGFGIRFQSAGQGPLELVKSMTMHAKQGIWLTPCVCE